MRCAVIKQMAILHHLLSFMNSSQNKLSFYHVLNRTKIEQLMAVVVVIFPQLEICGNSFIIFSYLLLIM